MVFAEDATSWLEDRNDYGVVGIAGHIENLDARVARGDLCGEFPAVMPGMTASVSSTSNGFWCSAATCIASAPDGGVGTWYPASRRTSAAFAQRRILLHEQNRFSARTEIERFLHDLGIGGLWNARQEREEHASASWLAFNPNIPTALFHNAVNGSEAEASAFALFFRREKWLEDARACFRVHAVSRIPNDNRNVVTWSEECARFVRSLSDGNVPGFDAQGPAVAWHRERSRQGSRRSAATVRDPPLPN
jgi:hypothetical protein